MTERTPTRRVTQPSAVERPAAAPTRTRRETDAPPARRSPTEQRVGRTPEAAPLLRGQVEAANDTGVKIGGRWYNYSKFDQVERPSVGQEVELVVHQGRWIRGLAVAGPEATTAEPPLAPDTPPAAADPDDPFAGLETAPEAAPLHLEAPIYTVHSSDPLLRRLALLRTAAEFHAGRAKSTDLEVIATAERFLMWLEQPRPGHEEEGEADRP